MKCNGRFIFRGMSLRDGGKFVNQNGQEISYKSSYQIKFDEVDENNECYERKVKVSTDDVELVNKLKTLEVYKPVAFQFEVGFNNNGVTLKLIDAEPLPKKTAQN